MAQMNCVDSEWVVEDISGHTECRGSRGLRLGVQTLSGALRVRGDSLKSDVWNDEVLCLNPKPYKP